MASPRKTGSRFGLTGEQWETAKREVRDALLAAARERQLTWYGELATKISVVEVDQESALLNYLLTAVAEDEAAAGGPALTAIVTRRYGDAEPADAFRDLARTLGYRFDEPERYWAQQVREVFKVHGGAI